MKTYNDLHDYQNDAIFKITCQEGTLVLADIGAGKTIITLTALLSLNAFPALVVAPKRVCELVWDAEAANWDHAQHLVFSKVLGTPNQRANALWTTTADVYLINYENLVWLMGPDGPDLPQFKAIVWDEISKMKSIGSRYKAVRKWAKSVPIRIGLTGTPVGNHMLGLWPQVNLIDNTRALLKSKTAFKNKWFYQKDYKGYDFRPFNGAVEEITGRMAPFTYRMNPEDYNQLPDLVINDIIVSMGEEGVLAYDELEKNMVLEIIDDTDDDYIEAANAAVLTGKLRQAAAGTMYTEHGMYYIHDAKMEALHELVDELAGEPLMVFYDFRYQQSAVLDTFPQARPLTAANAEAWNAGTVEIMVGHPASTGHGLNLQAGGNNVCFMSPHWSLELYEQSIGRLRRQGQDKPVFVHRLLSQGTIDHDVVDSLAGFGDEQSTVLRLLEKHRK